MKRMFFVEIETDGVCMSDASDIQLALVRYFVSGVRISVKEAAQHSVQRTVSHVHEKGVICPACHGEETDTPFTVHHH